MAREPLLPLFWLNFKVHFLVNHFFRSIFGIFAKKVAGEPLLPLFKARTRISKKKWVVSPGSRVEIRSMLTHFVGRYGIQKKMFRIFLF